MTNISDIITDVIAGKTTIEAIPENIRERVQNGIRVRQARHEGHSTTNNPDGTITAVNDRLRVTLPESEFISREHVFTTAMRVLAHRSETKQPIIEPADDETRELALKNLTYDFLAERCRYNLSETIMRMEGGHRMSEGMAADVTAARVRARHELEDNPAPHLAEARKILFDIINIERRYHENIAGWCANWNIEIIGPMPTQIGLCEYREEI